jgi:molecular chaperone GrpE
MKRHKGGDDEAKGRPAAPVVEASPDEPSGLTPVDAPAEAGGAEVSPSEIDELKDRLLRKAAEFDNYRKRVERDRAQAGVDAAAAVLKALVPTLDNLERALRAGGDAGPMREGVELTYRDFLAALQGQGVVVENPAAGERFDPARHEALAHESVPGFTEGDVIEVLRKGYSYADRLLRPALVKVAKGDGPASENPREKVH